MEIKRHASSGQRSYGIQKECIGSQGPHWIVQLGKKENINYITCFSFTTSSSGISNCKNIFRKLYVTTEFIVRMRTVVTYNFLKICLQLLTTDDGHVQPKHVVYLVLNNYKSELQLKVYVLPLL